MYMKKLTYRLNKNTYQRKKKRSVQEFEYGYLMKGLIRKYIVNDKDFIEDKTSKIVDVSNEYYNSKIKVDIDLIRQIKEKKNLPNYIPKEYLPEYFNKESKIDDNTLWFVKPNRSSQGKGIIITKEPTEYVDKDYVIQKLVIPKLIQNRTWCLRYFLLLYYENNKLDLWVTDDALIRQSLIDFDINIDPQDWDIMLIVNRHFQIRHKKYKELYNQNRAKKIGMLSENKHDLDYNKICKNLKIMAKKIKDKLYKDANGLFNEKNKSHEILAFDIIIEDDIPKVLEVNQWPGFGIFYSDKVESNQTDKVGIFEENTLKFMKEELIKKPLLDKKPEKGYFYKI